MNQQKLQIDFAALCASYGIRVAKPGERHYRQGWTCLPCPFCSGQTGNHLGFNPKANVFTCFRCGRHGKFETIAALMGITKKDAYEIAKKFSSNIWETLSNLRQESNSLSKKAELEKEHLLEGQVFDLPGHTKLRRIHRDYLLGRGFDPCQISASWDIRGTGVCGRYSYRIIIPITYRNKVVSFTSRDVTDQQQDRYLACPPAEALRHHKHCVYGLDQSTYRTCIVVEGPFGVWCVDKGAVGTCGTGWTHEQAKLIAKKFDKSYLFFDPEEKEAAERANKLSVFLASYNTHKSFVIEATGAHGRDTGELTKDEVKEVRKLLKR